MVDGQAATAARGAPPGSDVFISYSRADHAAVVALADGLHRRGRTFWIDWEGIAPTAEWMAEIRGGIDAADTVVFVLSPDAITSRVCGEELGYAVAQRKRIVPVVVRDVDAALVPADLARLHWLFARSTDDSEAAVDRLVEVLDTDLELVRIHTRLTVRAADWESSERDAGRLLRGADLAAAEAWLAAPGNGPDPTPAQVAFVAASRASATRRQRALLAGIAAALVVALLLSLVAWDQRGTAIEASDAAAHQALVADAQRLGAQARTVEDPALGVLLAAAGARLDDSRTTRSALLAALEQWDGDAGSFAWGASLSSMVPGVAGQMWLADDGAFVRGLRLDAGSVRSSTRSGSLPTPATTLGSDRTGRWVATVNQMGYGVVPGVVVPEGQQPVERSIQLYDTTRISDQATAPTGSYLPLPSPLAYSDVAPAISARSVVAVQAPASGFEPFRALTVQAWDPGEVPSGTVLHAYPLADVPRLMAAGPEASSGWRETSRTLAGPIRSLAVGPGGTVIAAVSLGTTGRVVVLDDATLAVRRTWAVPFAPTAVAALSKGTVAVGGTGGQILLIAADGRPRTTRRSHGGAIRVLAGSPDGTLLAAGSTEGRVTVRGLDGQVRYSFAPGSSVVGLAWSTSGSLLYAADRGGSVRAYDVQDDRRLAPVLATALPAPSGALRASGPDGRFVAVGGLPTDRALSTGYAIAILDTTTGRHVDGAARGASGEPFLAYSSVLSADGRRVFVATDRGIARWVTSGSRLTLDPGRPAVAPSQGFANGDGDAVVLARSGSTVAYLSGVSGSYTDAPVGSTAVQRIVTVDQDSLAPRGRPTTLKAPYVVSASGLPAYPYALVSGSDGAQPLLSCGLGCFARADLSRSTVTSVLDGSDTATKALVSDRVMARASATGGDVVVQGTDGGELRFFHGDPLVAAGPWVSANSGAVPSVAVSGDGSVAASGGGDGTVILWDPSTSDPLGPPLRIGSGITDSVTVVLVSASRLVTVDAEGTARSVATTPQGWAQLACRKAGRDLTAVEWARYLPGRPQVPLCAGPTAAAGSGTPSS